jgi:thiopeptide-type bacteriocin biosynthesis protein
MDSFLFHPKLMLRAPVRPIDPAFTRETLVRLLDDPAFLEAIYIASPVLHAECCKWKADPEKLQSDRERKLFRSLAKYYMRMTTRSTPFGLFSGCTIASWRDSETEKSKGLRFERHTRLDMHCICLLSEAICKMPAIRTRLLYQPNTSIYKFDKTIRYIEYTYHSGQRRYQISAVSLDDMLEKILKLSKEGLAYEELAKEIEKIGIDRKEADHYLEQLINAQVLVSNLEPSITGGDPLKHIITELRKLLGSADDVGLFALVSKLEEIANMLVALGNAPSNPASAYDSILEKLKEFELPLEQSKIFQVDLVTADEPIILGSDLQKKLIEAMEVCKLLAEPYTNRRLREFQQHFITRYGTAEVSLLRVLDEESGIGYGKQNSVTQVDHVENSFFIEPDHDRSSRWSARTRLLFDQLISALKCGSKAIVLDFAELKALNASDQTFLPPSMGVVFRCFKGGDYSTQVQFERAYGSSAVNILSRFAYADPNIDAWCKDIASTEEKINSDVCFVEIVHLPERRLGNILLHPAFRQMEIPYLARASVKKQNQIHAADLMISIKNGSIVLRDHQSGQQVIPRLSSAHNYGFHSLPVYWFLGDLQHQHVQPQLEFSWGPLYDILHFFPRVCYKGIVLSPATWKISKNDFVGLFSKGPGTQQEKMQHFINRFELPPVFLLSDGDNQLPVFTRNELSVMAFLDTIRNRSMIILQEIPGAETANTFDEETNFTRQFVASIIQSAPVYKNVLYTDKGKDDEQVRRNFAPASEWIYYKLYCGEKQADRLLTSCIIPLVEEIKQKKLSDKWFFIRYTDPDFHIRLRFHSADPHCIQAIIALVSEKLSGKDNGLSVWKLQLDTYTREIERYGSATITNAESVFCIDSEAVLYMLTHRQPTTDSNFSYCWLLKAIDDMLEAFELPLPAKLQLLQRIRESFAKEMQADKDMNKQLDARYRQIRSDAEALIAGGTGSLPKELVTHLAKRFTDLKRKSIRIKDILEQQDPGVPVSDLLVSFIHMTCNRVFISQPRRQEFMVYDFLSRYYRSRLARANQPAC